jgi:rhamnosyltransferase
MTEKSVCAVIVTYHPNPAMIANLAVTFTQVNGMVVVDNGSNPESLGALRVASKDLGFHLIENQENLGIAEALNQGVRWAIANGYPWVILFDQDSKITDHFIDRLFESWNAHPERERIGAMHPKYLELHDGSEAYVWRAKDGGPVRHMTSGALMPAWIFTKIGGFAAEFFIDAVDTEFCFRLRAAGYLIADSRSAVLWHSAGTSRSVAVFGFVFRPSFHTALRRYYMARNQFVVCRRYFRMFPGWILRYSYECFRETTKCLIGEQDRVRKLRNIMLGIWDGLRGRMGGRNDPQCRS